MSMQVGPGISINIHVTSDTDGMASREYVDEKIQEAERGEIKTVNGATPDENGNVQVSGLPEGAGAYQQLATDMNGRPTWKEPVASEGEVVAEWDGNTDGLESIVVGDGVMACKVSDVVPNAEAISRISIHIKEFENVDDQDISITQEAITIIDGAGWIVQNGAVHGLTAPYTSEAGITFTPGLWFLKRVILDPDIYFCVAAMTCGEKAISAECLPSTVPVFEEISEAGGTPYIRAWDSNTKKPSAWGLIKVGGYKGDGTDSVVMGNNEPFRAKGRHSVATGYNTHAKGDYSYAGGNGAIAYGKNSYAHGSSSQYNVTITGEGGATEYTIKSSTDMAIGDFIEYNMHRERILTRTRENDEYLVTLEGTLSNESLSNASGKHIITGMATGDYSHVEGSASNATGDYSHAEGRMAMAYGNYSSARGNNAFAYGDYSHAEGYMVNAQGDYSHVQGKLNVITTASKYAHIVGNGSSNADRSNAYTLDWEGNGWFAGGLKVGGTGQDDAEAKEVATVDQLVKLTDTQVKEILVAETLVQIVNLGGEYRADPVPFDCEIIEGETYTVTFDGNEYELTGYVDSDGYPAIGNLNNGDPFYYARDVSSPADSWFQTTTAGNHTISIAKMKTGKQIPETYLPTTVPVIPTATVGQTIVVKAVDDTGKPTEWEAVDMASAEPDLIFEMDNGQNWSPIAEAGGTITIASGSYVDIMEKIKSGKQVNVVLRVYYGDRAYYSDQKAVTIAIDNYETEYDVFAAWFMTTGTEGFACRCATIEYDGTTETVGIVRVSCLNETT